jgi:2-polyprenyl-3-methyl-5-hydroxy-6-metoxy-1,4-benzoquinol methylase
MRRVPESEIETDFEKQFCWGDDERYLYNPNRRKASVFGHFLRIEEVLRLVREHCRGKRVADLACAQGNFGLLLAEQGYDVTAVDIHPEFLKYAKKKHTTGKFLTVQANLIEFRDPQGFDCVLAGEVIEHVAFPDKLIESVRANLKPGGICVITTPNGSDYSSRLPTYKQVSNIEELIPRQFHWGDHLFLYTEAELRELFKNAGLEVVYLEKYHSAYVSQLKAIRYLLPMAALKLIERGTRHMKKQGKDSANLLIAVARRPK